MINYAQAKRLVEKATGPKCHHDLRAAAWRGLGRAIATHNPRASSFAAWAVFNAHGYMANQGRSWKKQLAIGEPTDQIDELSDDGAQRSDPLVRAAIERAFASLPPRQAEAARLVLVEGMRKVDAAVVMGVTPSAVLTLVARARVRLQLALNHIRTP